MDQLTGGGGLTAFISAAAAALRLDDVPEAALASVRGGIADCLGVLVAGVDEPAARIVRDVVADGGAEASLLPGGARCGARGAALINGVAAHVLDFDDVGMQGHPTAVLLPAILAEAETLGARCGELLAAYVAGYEAWGVLFATASAPLHGRGWHPSGVNGAVAAAVACAKLRGLDAEGITRAMGIAAGQASGVLANFGTGTKSFQTARAAESGLLAARLAQAGLTAGRNIFDRDGDFAKLFAGGASGQPIAAFGAPDWVLATQPIGIKVYPVCYAAHRLIDAALAIRGGADVAAITRIEARLSRVSSEILYALQPEDALEAKFSAEFAVASALQFGSVALADLQPARRDALRGLMAKVMRRTDEFGDEAHAPFDAVTLFMADGGVVNSPEVCHPAGSPQWPVTRAQAEQKFTRNVAGYFDADAAADWFDRIWTMRAGDKVTRILPLGQ
jgi:2-methylcitrate dehydratase PrpD